jgi:proline dehydrogenase
MTHLEASEIIEDVLDTLVEVGNGATDKMLHEAGAKLFKFRDEYLKKAEASLARLSEVLNALDRIENVYVPALLRDAREADKTHCNAQSINGICVRLRASL